jgi:uncharacterized CHY-type Zn-finger protein
MEQAQLQPTRPENAFVRIFPCAACGAKLSFAPGTSELACEFCGARNAFAESDQRVEELDFATWVAALAGRQETFEAQSVRCGKCGAEQMLGEGEFASSCAFCRGPVVGQGYANRLVKPRSVLPFQVDREKAKALFRDWIRWQWLAPNDLRRYAQTDAGLDGVYLPFWTFDSSTVTDYTGQRGNTRDGKTSWTSVSGQVSLDHDDVTVLASPSLPDRLTTGLQSWDTSALVSFQPEYLSGFRAEAYRIGLEEAHAVARKKMEAAIASAIRRQIGGSEQRIDRSRTRYGAFTFKHVMLPAWISAYRYRDKPYRFVVNGQTGEVAGESPVSGWKVAMIVVFVLFLLYLNYS